MPNGCAPTRIAARAAGPRRRNLAALPLALLGYALTWAWFAASGVDFAMPFGPRPWFFVGLMAAIGLLASWLGAAVLERDQPAPAATIASQLIVFGSSRRWPMPSCCGHGGHAHAGRHRLLVAGVLWALRSGTSPEAAEAHPELTACPAEH